MIDLLKSSRHLSPLRPFFFVFLYTLLGKFQLLPITHDSQISISSPDISPELQIHISSWLLAEQLQLVLEEVVEAVSSWYSAHQVLHEAESWRLDKVVVPVSSQERASCLSTDQVLCSGLSTWRKHLVNC